ncbi:MAG: hypothetical protein F7C35_06150 [Desulfurococcales archaeon]|nr:hypothetical protein [Desulfurococcales archaeon]
MSGGGRVTFDTIKKWLVEGKDNPDNLVDLKWSIIDEKEEEGSRALRATHPKVPINLLVLSAKSTKGKEFDYVRLVIETFIETRDLPPETKLKFYRILLDLPKLPLTKLYLYGPDDTVGIAADLDLRSLSKEEFDDALAMLLLVYTYLKKLSTGLEELMTKEEILMLGLLVRNYIEKGMTKDEIIDTLVKNGLPKEIANDLVNTVYTITGGSEKRGSDSLYM